MKFGDYLLGLISGNMLENMGTVHHFIGILRKRQGCKKVDFPNFPMTGAKVVIVPGRMECLATSEISPAGSNPKKPF